MSGRTIVVVMLALVFGVSTALLVSVVVRQPPTEVPDDRVAVVVTTIDIPPGATITAGMLETREYPKDMVPAGSFTNKNELLDRNKPHAAKMPILRGEPILTAKVSKHPGLGGVIRAGHRAFSIPVADPAMGVAGFIMPRNHVDVLLTLRTQSGRSEDGQPNDGGAVTATMLQDVEILAVGDEVDPLEHQERDDRTRFRTVTLSVTPDQAAMLHLGSTQGILHLSLRNPDDHEIQEPEVATLQGIRYRQPDSLHPAAQDLLMTRMQQLLSQMNEQHSADRLQLESRIRELEQANRLVDGELGAERDENLNVIRVHTLRGMHRGRVDVRVPKEEEPQD